MIFVLKNVLNEKTINRLRALLRGATFVDGMQSGGGSVAHVKKNTEVEVDSQAHTECDAIIREALRGNSDFRIIAQIHGRKNHFELPIRIRINIGI